MVNQAILCIGGWALLLASIVGYCTGYDRADVTAISALVCFAAGLSMDRQ